MLLHYFYKKENKEKNYVNDIYLKNLRLSIKFIQSNNYILKKDFQTSFEIFSLFLIFHLKNFKDFKIKNHKKINQELINLFVKDLDYSFREIGVGDIKIKHNKKWTDYCSSKRNVKHLFKYSIIYSK